MKELVAKICREMSSLHGKSPNYIVVQSLINTFVKNNPDADPLEVDWAAIYDPRLTYEEMLEELKRSYPQYKWSDPGHVEEKEFEDSVINHILTQVEELSDEGLRRLYKALEEHFEARAVEENETTETVTEARKSDTAPASSQDSLIAEKQSTAETMTPKINLRLLATYPFLQEAKQFAKALDITEVEEEVLSRAGERVIEAIERYEVTAKLEKPFIEFASYPVAKMIVHHLSNDWLRKRWALAEAVRVEKQLNIEILQVFEHVLKSLNITVKNVGDHYMIHFTDYLRLAERLTSNTRWKLVNRTLSRGYVHLTRSEVCRLAREAAYNIFSDFSALPKNLKPPEKILNQLNEINQILAAKAKTITTPSNKNEWPPCIHAIANRISDASHFECFTLAAFLTNKGYTVEQVVDIFRARADFDEKIARYQVEHIAGKRGSGTIYRPPSCPTMQAHNLCIEKGKLCPKNIKNPLQYGMMDRDASSAAVCF